jgi:hypothetical protein
MPVGYVLVGDARGHIKHDDAALAVDVVAITKTTKLLLAGCVPDIELDLAQVLPCCQPQTLHSPYMDMEYCAYRCESKRVNLDTEGCNVLLLELSRQMALDECRL